MSELLLSIKDNFIFVLEFLGIIAALFAIAYLTEWLHSKKEHTKLEVFTTRKICLTGLFSALSFILMLFEFPLPFAPSFYKLDFSELPILIAAFAFGPVAGVMAEFVKILLNLLFTGTTTAFVGELANFAVGCSFILPASIFHLFAQKKKGALLGVMIGTLTMTVFGTAFNALYLLPKFAQLYGMPLDALIGMGTAINPGITNITTFVIFAVAPLNLIKGVADSVVAMLIYIPLSPIIRFGTDPRNQHKITDKTATTM